MIDRPLPRGTEIEFAGMRATVIDDSGGPTLRVFCEGSVHQWRWHTDGETCKVVPTPFIELIVTCQAVVDGLDGLLLDEDLDENKLQEASEGLLPNLADTLRRAIVKAKGNSEG